MITQHRKANIIQTFLDASRRDALPYRGGPMSLMGDQNRQEFYKKLDDFTAGNRIYGSLFLAAGVAFAGAAMVFGDNEAARWLWVASASCGGLGLNHIAESVQLRKLETTIRTSTDEALEKLVSVLRK